MCVFACFVILHSYSCFPSWELLLHGFDKSLEIHSVVWSLKVKLGKMGAEGMFWKVIIKCWELFMCKDLSQNLPNIIFWVIVSSVTSPLLLSLLLLGTSSCTVNSCACHLTSFLCEKRGCQEDAKLSLNVIEGTHCKMETSVISIKDTETYLSIWNSLCELWHCIGTCRFRWPGKSRI